MSLNSSNSNNSNFMDEVAKGVHEVIIPIIIGLLLLLRKLFNYFWERYQESNGIYKNKPIEPYLIKKKKKAKSIHAIGYSINRRKVFKHNDLDSTTHTGIFGTTGSGKSVLLENLLNRALSKGGPVIYFDPKPTKESVKRFKLLCSHYGRETHVFADFEEDSVMLNPLLLGDTNEVLSQIMDSLEWSEIYYKNECQEALLQALSDIKKEFRRFTISLIIEKLEENQNKKSIGSIINQLKLLDRSNMGELIDTHLPRTSISFVNTTTTCLYIGIPSINIGSAGNILNKLIFGEILLLTNHILTGKWYEQPMTMSIFFDELSSTVHEGFIDLLNKCRAANIEVYYATQCPSDLDKVSERFKKQVLENTNNYFVFNQTLQEHTELFAALAGTSTTIKYTSVLENGLKTGKESGREVESFNVHPNTIRGLEVGQSVFIQRKPCRRVDLLNITMLPIDKLEDQKPTPPTDSAF